MTAPKLNLHPDLTSPMTVGPEAFFDEPPLTLVVCSECDGAGEWDEGPINCGGPAPVDPEYRQVICPVCGGKGQTVEPVQSDDEADDIAF